MKKLEKDLLRVIDDHKLFGDSLARVRSKNASSTAPEEHIKSAFIAGSDDFRKVLIERGFEHWRKEPVPLPSPSEEMLKKNFTKIRAFEVEKMLEKGDIIRSSSSGVSAPNSYHPHRYEVKCGTWKTVQEAWNDDKHLRRMVKAALQMAGKCDRGTMSAMAATSQTQTVANFLPAVAKFLYHTFTKFGGRILDPSAGYGGRAFGVSALDQREYIGIDPTLKTIHGNMRLVEDLTRLNLLNDKRGTTLSFVQGCAEEIMPLLRDESFDFIFTSPPYFDIEKYDPDNPRQSFRKFPEYHGWLNGFLRILMREATRIIKPGGHIAWNIANVRKHNTEADLIKLAVEEGLNLKHILKMRMSRRATLRQKGGDRFRFEPIFVFQRKEDYPSDLTDSLLKVRDRSSFSVCA